LDIDERKNEAKITTSKFVRLPKFETLNLEIEMVRDLLERDNSHSTPCTVKTVRCRCHRRCSLYLDFCFVLDL
jgi:hypothetical protein